MYLKPTGVSCSSTPCCLGDGVDQVGGGDRLGYAVLPAAALDQVIEQQGDDVVGLKEGAVGVDDAEAVGIAVGGNADVRPGLAHLLAQGFEQMIVRLGGVSAEQNVAAIVHGRNLARLRRAAIRRSIRALLPKHGIEHDLQSRLADGVQIDHFPQARQVIRLGIE